MISVRVRFPPGEEQKLKRFLDPQRMRTAEKEAINRSAANGTKFGQKQVAKAMGITASKLRKRGNQWQGGKYMGNVSQGKRATNRFLNTTIRSIGRPFNLNRFNAAETGTGATHDAYGREQHAKGLFILPVKGRPVVVPQPGRTPQGKPKLRSAYGPGAAWVMRQRENSDPLIRFLNRRFRHHWRSRVRYYWHQK